MAFSTLRVLTYNVHAGVGMDGRLDLERIAQVIRSSCPDLVALQEVDRKTERSQSMDQAVRYAELTGLHGVFRKAINYDGGEYGQAVLSRWPLSQVEVHHLPTVPDDEPRIAVAARLHLGKGGPELLFVATHFSWQSPPAIQAQAERVNALFAAPEKRLRIVAGDFNTGPSTSPLQTLCNSWTDVTSDELTCPADNPTSKIDYIMTGPRLRLIKTKTINEPVASDHRPVLSVLALDDENSVN